MLKDEMRYNGCIEVWRYVMTFLVALMHFYHINFPKEKIFEGCYVAVDFFFMLSGFYLIKTLTNNNAISAVNYSIRKYKNIFVIYAFTVLFYDAIYSLKGGANMVFLRFISSIPDFLCLQMIGFYSPASTPIMWYISAMMIAGLFISILFRLSHKITSNIFFPTIILIGYSTIYLYGGNLDFVKDMNGEYIIKPGLIRAFSGMSLGGGYLFDIQQVTTTHP